MQDFISLNKITLNFIFDSSRYTNLSEFMLNTWKPQKRGVGRTWPEISNAYSTSKIEGMSTPRGVEERVEMTGILLAGHLCWWNVPHPILGTLVVRVQILSRVKVNSNFGNSLKCRWIKGPLHHFWVIINTK